MFHLGKALHRTETAARLVLRRSDLAQRRLSIAPALDIESECDDAAVQVLDLVGRSQRPTRRILDSEGGEGDRLGAGMPHRAWRSALMANTIYQYDLSSSRSNLNRGGLSMRFMRWIVVTRPLGPSG